jgi:hypothetical protein
MDFFTVYVKDLYLICGHRNFMSIGTPMTRATATSMAEDVERSTIGGSLAQCPLAV